MAAGLLAQLPGLLSMGQSSGFFDTIKNIAGNVLGDLGSGKVHSGSDFGQSLARAGASALGIHPKDESMMKLNARLAQTSQNAADHRATGGDVNPTMKRASPFTPANVDPFVGQGNSASLLADQVSSTAPSGQTVRGTIIQPREMQSGRVSTPGVRFGRAINSETSGLSAELARDREERSRNATAAPLPSLSAMKSQASSVKSLRKPKFGRIQPRKKIGRR